MSIWSVLVAAFGTVGMVVAGAFAARATKQAANVTADAQRAVAAAAAEPEQRRVDLEAFQAIRDDLRREVQDLRQETNRLRGIVRAFASYVGELTMQMRDSGVEPVEPPDPVREYNRTGV